MLSPKRWLQCFIGTLLLGASVLAGAAYALDPFMYYREGTDLKTLSSKFMNMGIIKHHPYTTAVIGSSMAQNFDMAYFREKLGGEPVKLVVSGMSANELMKMFCLSEKYSSAQRYILNIDLTQFNSSDPMDMRSTKLPEYLYNESRVDDIKYLLGYEAWTRYIPVNLVINGMARLGRELPENLLESTRLDRIDDWSNSAKFGKGQVMDKYLSGACAPTRLDQTEACERMKRNIDIFLETVAANRKEGQTIVFGLPPYSALYWHTTQEDGSFDTIMAVKEHLLKRCGQYDWIRVVDMQPAQEIVELDHYKDLTHFDLTLQQLYAEAIINGTRDLRASECDAAREALEERVRVFEEANRRWLAGERLMNEGGTIGER